MSPLHVICKIADAEYAIPADEVYQLESFNGATPVPGAPAYVIGLVQVRQQVVAVLDARLRFGFEAVPATSESRVLVLKLGARLVGILVDSAREVQNIAPEQLREPPEAIVRQSQGFVKSVAQLKNRIVILLDAHKVVGEEPAHAQTR